MKRKLFLLLLVGAVFITWGGFVKNSFAGVNINITIPPPPPPLVIPTPPPVMVIPDTYVYYPPEVNVDIFFYGGYWYRPHQGYWYRSKIYNGKWGYWATDRVPPVLLHIDPNFRHLPPGHRRVEYSHFRKNWRTWEREKYWDKHGYGYDKEHWKDEGPHGKGYEKDKGHHEEESHHGSGPH